MFYIIQYYCFTICTYYLFLYLFLLFYFTLSFHLHFFILTFCTDVCVCLSIFPTGSVDIHFCIVSLISRDSYHHLNDA